jgi:formylglycine-generating enzyme required for sulfatase activity
MKTIRWISGCGVLAAFALGTGCNAIIGAEETTLDPNWGNAGAAGVGGTAGASGTGGAGDTAGVDGGGDAGAAGTGGTDASAGGAGGTDASAGGSGGAGGAGGTDSGTGGTTDGGIGGSDSSTGGAGGTGGTDSGTGGKGGADSGTGGAGGTDSGTGGKGGTDSGTGGTDSGTGGAGGTDGCAPETDGAFCSRLAKNCGTVTAANNCGTSRSVTCGSCTAPYICSNASVCLAPSCLNTEGQWQTCSSESCCTTINVPGGTFPQGRNLTGGPDFYTGGNPNETPDFQSTVSTFALDKYEVTVGRFRKFVNAYVNNLSPTNGGTAPKDGAGANPNVAITGDASDNGTGWQSAWNTNLPATQAAFKTSTYLKCGAGSETWTDTAINDPDEQKAINCVSWYEAFAFCIWDGGRLPTESEWEYAAAGGAYNQLYPWASGVEPTCTFTNFGNICGPGGVMPVGSFPAGNGRWTHADLAGNVSEWTLDWYSITYPSPDAGGVTDYVNLIPGSSRVKRGGDFYTGKGPVRAAARTNDAPGTHDSVNGFRCARP